MEPTGVPNLFRRGGDLFTKNADPGQRLHGEEIVREDSQEYRKWDPWRSKLAAYLLNRDQPLILPSLRRVLYLGAAHGTTASHLADLSPDGAIFVVEKSPVNFVPLLTLARRRRNLNPILGDAQLPERYQAEVGEVDFLYQDVAQRDQAAIFVENAEALLAPSGEGLLMLKTLSVTQRRPPALVLGSTKRDLAHAGLSVRESVELGPFARQHFALRVRR